MSPVLFDVTLLVSAVALLAAAVVLYDAPGLARAALRRRRLRRGGVYGVVMDPHGVVLGTYLDPFATRAAQDARVHDTSSPWASRGADGRLLWAWEGFGATVAEAERNADRLRRRHVSLFPWLAAPDGGDDELGHLRLPASPPGSWE